MAFAVLVNDLAPPLLFDNGWRVIVRVTASFALAPDTWTVNGTPGPGVESDTVETKPEASYSAIAVLGARMKATAAAATSTARRIMARSPDELLSLVICPTSANQSGAYRDLEQRDGVPVTILPNLTRVTLKTGTPGCPRPVTMSSSRVTVSPGLS